MADPIRDWQKGRIRKAAEKAFADSAYQLADLNDTRSPVDFFLTFTRKDDPAGHQAREAVVTQDKSVLGEDALGAYLRQQVDPK